MMTNLDPVSESIRRCTQFRGPVPHEQDVRRIANEIIAAMNSGQLAVNDLKAIADSLECACRKGNKMMVV